MKILKKYKYHIMAFLIPILLLLFKFIIDGISFNSNSILVSDMNSQYIALFSYLQDVFNGKESIFYSFNNGLGNSMYAAFAYYLSSPLNILVVFFDKSNLPLFVTMLLFLKVGLCGLTMNIYLSNKFNIKKIDTVVFSICYALMSYIINYHFNTMWLDGVYMLPLVMLGIDKIIKYDKITLYFLSLFIAIISNFYIGYMICVFSVIYFIYSLILECSKKEYRSKIIKFTICSLLSGLCTAFLTLPTFLELINFARPIDSYDNNIINKILYLLRDLFVGSHKCTELINNNGTYIYCGIFIIYLIYCYFINIKINKKEKVVHSIVLLFLILSSIISPFQYFWHGMSNINSFNNRFSFIISFYMILLAIKSFINLDKISIKKSILFIIIYFIIGLILLIQNYISLSSLLISVIFIIIYILILNNIKMLKPILLVFVCLELFLNTYISFLINKDTSNSFSNFYETFCDEVSKLDLNYRVSKNYNYGGLDSLLCKYSSVTNYISTNTKDSFNFFYNTGYQTASIVRIDETTNTRIMDSLLGVKYSFSDIYNKYEPLNSFVNLSYYDSDSKTKLDSKYYLYKNDDVLSIAYMIDSSNIKNKNSSFLYQNELVRKMSGINENSLKKLKYEKISNTQYKIDTSDFKEIYIKINYNQNTSFFDETIYKVYINEEKLSTKNYSIFYYLNDSFDDEIKLNIDIKNNEIEIEDIEAYAIDEEIFKKQISKLKENEAENIIKNNNKLSFNIDTNKSGTLLLTLPYDKGFSIYVDGKKVSYKKIVDMFIGIDLSTGNHYIELKYVPYGFNIGIFISSFSFLLIICYVKFSSKIK